MKDNGFKLTKERSWRHPIQTITDADNADDIALLANTSAQAETLLHSLEQAAAGISLHVNSDKTEYMCFNLKRRHLHNKLFKIQPTLGEWRPAPRKSRREQVVISRLRIGHTRLTHSFILKQEPQPQCLTCTVKHILIECRTSAVIRKRFFIVNNLTDLFENIKINDILSFLRETELDQKIWQLKTG